MTLRARKLRFLPKARAFPYKGEGYFATLPQLDFAEARRTKDSITFAAQPSAGVEILKTYRFNENGINNLSLTFNNKNEHEVALPAFDFNFGPGLSTTQSELSDNERESKAVYLTQEPGKKNPTPRILPPPAKTGFGPVCRTATF